PLSRAPPPLTSLLSLHDALPIWLGCAQRVLLLARRRITAVDRHPGRVRPARGEHIEHGDDELAEPGIQIRILELQTGDPAHPLTDRKSTRLNSSHQIISYAVFCV